MVFIIYPTKYFYEDNEFYIEINSFNKLVLIFLLFINYLPPHYTPYIYSVLFWFIASWDILLGSQFF